MSTSSKSPRVSMVMAVHNGEPFLRQAIESVLQQTLGDFELIVVDDASTDDTVAIVRSYVDSRIRLLCNADNRGQSASLDRGVGSARADYIARLDADDICEPQRLELQIQALDEQQELAALGTWTTEIDEHGDPAGGFELPPSEGLLRWSMVRTNVLFHPTAIIRREALDAVGGYNVNMHFANDYDLFTRMLMNGWRLNNLPRQLVRYRRSSGQISTAHVEKQSRDALKIRRRYVQWLLGGPVCVKALEQATLLQAPFGDACAVDLASTVPLLRRIRRRCLRGCDALGRSEINRRSRGALLYHARQLRDRGQYDGARMLWREAWRCGRRLSRDSRLWRQAMDLGVAATVRSL